MQQAENSREKFAQLYDEFMPRVFRYIHYKVNNKQLTEDLSSSVFEKALVNFSKYSRDRAAFSTWIFSIARNVVIDYYRTNGKRQGVSTDEAIGMPARDPSPEEEAERKAERECLRLCMAKLSQQEQEIMHLKFAAELNNRQIARMLSLSESNVGIILFRAVRKLRDNFQESWNE